MKEFAYRHGGFKPTLDAGFPQRGKIRLFEIEPAGKSGETSRQAAVVLGEEVFSVFSSFFAGAGLADPGVLALDDLRESVA